MPQPDGPIKAVILLRGISIVISLTASEAPYHTERPRVESTIGSVTRAAPADVAGAAPGGSLAPRSARVSETLINGLVKEGVVRLGSALIGVIAKSIY